MFNQRFISMGRLQEPRKRELGDHLLEELEECWREFSMKLGLKGVKLSLTMLSNNAPRVTISASFTKTEGGRNLRKSCWTTTAESKKLLPDINQTL